MKKLLLVMMFMSITIPAFATVVLDGSKSIYSDNNNKTFACRDNGNGYTYCN